MHLYTVCLDGKCGYVLGASSGPPLIKRVLEALINGGACDCFGVRRAELLHTLDAVVTKVQKCG